MAAKEIQFRCRLSYPLEGGEAHFDRKKIAEYYADNENGRGGWYPIGASQTWHNGVHITAPENRSVRSMAKGTIVAARLSEKQKEEPSEYGTPTFVLVKHQLSLLKNPEEKDHNNWKTRDIEFYSLYMHLEIDPSGTPWMKGLAPFLDIKVSDETKFFKVNTDEDGDKKKGPRGLNCRQKPTVEGKIVKRGELAGLLPQGTIVQLLEGKMGEWQEVNAPSLSLKNVWVYGEGNRLAEVNDFKEQLKAIQEGGCARFEYPVESGEVIGQVGKIHPARKAKLRFTDHYGIHFEVFAKENLIADEGMSKWTLVKDDTDNDVICEYSDLLKKVDKPNLFERLGWDTTNFVEYAEVERYMKSRSDKEKEYLRHLITKNTSYWAVDWANLKSGNPDWAREFELDDEDVKVANSYMWWKECQDKKVDLPKVDDGKVLLFHFHPIALMEYIDKHLPPTPIFYVKRGEKELVVAKPSDINIAGEEKVWVYEPGVQDWLLGKGATLQGCQGIGNFGETTLYEALINPATTPGIPSMDDEKKHCWASIWFSEGCLEALNSYDSAFLSFGPIQQTVGTQNNKGELQGAINYVKTKNNDVFKKYFGDYKLDAVQVEKVNKVDKGHFSLDGKVMSGSADKEVFREFIWAYRCVKAMNDTTFRSLFLEHGFKRLEVIKELKATVGGEEVTLGDVYKMEASLALLLDAHINLPTLVDSSNGIWVRAAKDVLGISGDEKIDTSKITRDNEYDMIAKIVELRNNSNMWSPDIRAGHILLCAKDLTEEVAKKFGYDSLDDLKTSTGKTAAKAAPYMYNFLGHSR